MQNKRFAIIVTVYLLLFCCFANAQPILNDNWVTTLKSENLHGKVNWVSIAIVHNDSDVNGIVAYDSLFFEYSTFNEQGKLTYRKLVHAECDGEPEQTKTGKYTYNSNGQLIESEGFMHLGGKMLRKYNGKDLTEEYAYKKDGSPAFKHVIIYDKGRRIRTEQYIPGKEYPSNIKYYDHRGNETEIVFFNNNGPNDSSVNGRHTQKFDARNYMTEAVQEDYITGHYQKETFQYDDKGNSIEHVKYKSRDTIERRVVSGYDAGGHETSAYHYDANGKLTRKSSFTNKYNSTGLLIEKVEKSSYFERDVSYNSTISELYQDVDKEGNWLRKTYIIDGFRDRQLSVTYRKIGYYE